RQDHDGAPRLGDAAFLADDHRDTGIFRHTRQRNAQTGCLERRYERVLDPAGIRILVDVADEGVVLIALGIDRLRFAQTVRVQRHWKFDLQIRPEARMLERLRLTYSRLVVAVELADMDQSVIVRG